MDFVSELWRCFSDDTVAGTLAQQLLWWRRRCKVGDTHLSNAWTITCSNQRDKETHTDDDTSIYKHSSHLLYAVFIFFSVQRVLAFLKLLQFLLIIIIVPGYFGYAVPVLHLYHWLLIPGLKQKRMLRSAHSSYVFVSFQSKELNLFTRAKHVICFLIDQQEEFVAGLPPRQMDRLQYSNRINPCDKSCWINTINHCVTKHSGVGKGQVNDDWPNSTQTAETLPKHTRVKGTNPLKPGADTLRE